MIRNVRGRLEVRCEKVSISSPLFIGKNTQGKTRERIGSKFKFERENGGRDSASSYSFLDISHEMLMIPQVRIPSLPLPSSTVFLIIVTQHTSRKCFYSLCVVFSDILVTSFFMRWRYFLTRERHLSHTYLKCVMSTDEKVTSYVFKVCCVLFLTHDRLSWDDEMVCVSLEQKSIPLSYVSFDGCSLVWYISLCWLRHTTTTTRPLNHFSPSSSLFLFIDLLPFHLPHYGGSCSLYRLPILISSLGIVITDDDDDDKTRKTETGNRNRCISFCVYSHALHNTILYRKFSNDSVR